MRIIGNNPAADNAEITAVASGTLPSGKTVIVNADGTVSVIAAGASGFLGGTVFESADSRTFSGAFDSNANSVVILYKDVGNSSYPTVVAGSVSGSSISFGTPTVISSHTTSGTYACGAVVFDSSNNKVAIAYYGGSSALFMGVVATVSGTAISLGSITQLQGVRPDYISGAFDSTNNKVVIAYRDNASTKDGQVFVCTVSGTSISAGSIVTFDTGGTGGVTDISTVFDSNAGKIVISYRDPPTNDAAGTSIVGTVSGTTISFGSKVVFDTTYSYRITSVFDSSSNKIIIAYSDAFVSGSLIVVGTVSGTAISFGTPYRFNTVNTQHIRLIFDTQTNKPLLFYRVAGAAEVIGSVVNVSGTSASLGTPLTLAIDPTGSQGAFNVVWDSTANKSVPAFSDTGNSGYGTSGVIAFPNSNLTAENFIGFAGGAVGVTETLSEAIGTPVVFKAAVTTYTGAAFDSNSNKVVIGYVDDDSGDGTAIVGTVDPSNNSISFGTPVVFANAGNISYVSVVFDSSSNKIVISYRDGGNSTYGTSIVGTVSGTGISFGTAVVFESARADYISSTFDSNLSKVVISYQDGGTSFQRLGTAIVGTVSGTNISFGTAVVFENAITTDTSTTFDSSTNKVVISYRDQDNSGNGTAIVGTVSGTGISFGSAVVFEAANSTKISSASGGNSKVVITYRDNGNSNYGTAIVGTVSGTSISFGTAVVFNATTTTETSCVFNSALSTFVVTYEDYASGEHGKVVVGTVSGTGISFGSASVFENANIEYLTSTFDSNSNRVVLAYKDSPNSQYGTAVVVRNAGVYPVTVQVASGDNAVIDIGSAISTNQSGLTAGQQYFVQTDGTLGLTADDPSVIAGTAISATEIIVKG